MFINNVPNIANQLHFNQNNNHITASPYNQQISGTGINDGLYIVSTQTSKSSTPKILFIAAISIVNFGGNFSCLQGIVYV
ncbi:MAG: hypothetical protein CM15mP2_0110 [Methanobacteriota archaeon]|nr:MAG: hypothetical protein CM15mP2_0110 [Euryarchaeota archaeon]